MVQTLSTFFVFEWNEKKLTKLCGSGKCVVQTLSTFSFFEWNEKKLTKLCSSGKCVVQTLSTFLDKKKVDKVVW